MTEVDVDEYFSVTVYWITQHMKALSVLHLHSFVR